MFTETNIKRELEKELRICVKRQEEEKEQGRNAERWKKGSRERKRRKYT